MNRKDVALAVGATRGNAAVVVGAGATSGFIFEHADAPATLYSMELFYASAVALGVALAKPDRQVIAVEGEGSFFGGSPLLAGIQRARCCWAPPKNLTIVVTATTASGARVRARNPPLPRTARISSCSRVAMELVNARPSIARAKTKEELVARLREGLSSAGPLLIVVDLDDDEAPSSSPSRPRPHRHLLDCAAMMRSELAGTWDSLP